MSGLALRAGIEARGIESEQYVVQWQRDRNVRGYNRDELPVWLKPSIEQDV